MKLGQYILYRFLALFLQLFGAIGLVFTLLRFIPYDPTLFFLISNRSIDPEERERQLAELRSQLGLDKSLVEQYIDFITDLLFKQSLGNSWSNGEPVMDSIMDALPLTTITFGLAFLVYTPLAIFLGIAAAYYRGGLLDTSLRVMTTATYAIPSYILGLWTIIYFAPPGLAPWPRPYPGDFLGLLKLSLFPILVVILAYTGFQFRLVRAQMLEILRSDYIRTARAKGLTERMVLYKHAFRNGLPFYITTIAVTFPIAFSGVAALEVVFQIPGIGLLMVRAANSFDWPVLIGVTAVFTIFNAILLSVTDIMIHLVDPKLRLDRRFTSEF